MPREWTEQKKNFKEDIANIFKELKEAKLKELKDSISFVSHKILNINNGIEIFKRNQIKIL